MAYPILVVRDRCRAEGLAGTDPLEAFGALLDFDPVPRLTRRADGRDAEVQRAYIAALSLTGSDRAACRAVGKSAFAITRRLAHEGADSFEDWSLRQAAAREAEAEAGGDSEAEAEAEAEADGDSEADSNSAAGAAGPAGKSEGRR